MGIYTESFTVSASQLVAYPDIGRAVESNLYEGLRSVPCKDFPVYQILFLMINEEMTIARILHGARDIPRLLNN